MVSKGKLHIFDFDGTLFRSPEPSGDKGKWWSSPGSLSEPCVPDKPGPEWWNSPVVADAKKSISNPDVYAVLMTGRKDAPFRWRIPELLKAGGLNFDEVIMSPGGTVAAYKGDTVDTLLYRYPFIDEVKLWDDEPRNQAAIKAVVERHGIPFKSVVPKIEALPCVAPAVIASITEKAMKTGRNYFEPGDMISWGKYKNKPAVIRGFGHDKHGNPTVLIDPVPKGRKQTKEMGLYKIWRRPTPDVAKAQGAGGSPLISRPAYGRVAARYLKKSNAVLASKYEKALKELREAVAYAKARELGNTSSLWLVWFKFYDVAGDWGAYVIDHLAFPPKAAKGIEMAVRLLGKTYGRGKSPPSIIKWFEQNERRFALLDQARSWPERSEESGIFKQGPFIVHNTVQAEGAVLNNAKDIIDRALRALPKAGVPGFAQTAYGPLFLVGQIRRKNWAAWYMGQKDAIYLRPVIRGISVENSARHLVHELGHRFWDKKLDAKTKKAWIQHHTALRNKHIESKLPDEGDVLPLQVNRKTVRVQEFEKPSGKALLVDVKTGQPVGSVGLLQLIGWMQEVNDKGKYPTPYSATNAEEHFCEALSLKAFGKLKGESLEAFDRIMHDEPSLEVKIATRYLEAKGFREWVGWMVQPFEVIWKHHRDFVRGPIDDAADAIIKELAPHLVRELAKVAVKSAVEEAGNPKGEARRQVIRQEIVKFRGEITEEVVRHLAKKFWGEINPVNMVKEVLRAVRQHGWKIGLAYALGQLVENALWAVVAYLASDPKYLALTALPLAEAGTAIALKILGRVPPEVDKADEAGHLEWYEKHFGPVRLAALRA